jgi:hypothetical protein
LNSLYGKFAMREKEKTVYWQDIAPNHLVSWKVHCRNGIPPSATIVAFHGKPKPWELGPR